MNESTTVCIAGGGPAGTVLGLLLARSGIDVIVLEKHSDFLRDFRGDTIHPSTLDVLDEIGLGARFERLDHRKLDKLSVVTDDGEYALADLSVLRGRHPYFAMVPQWDFLKMITDEGLRRPGFRLLMKAQAYDLILENGQVSGLCYRDEKGEEHQIRALLTVAADGRHSDLRRAARLRPREYGAPMDVAWFRLPRMATDREDVFFRIGARRALAAINRGTYWQLGYLLPKGGYDETRRQGIGTLRRSVGELVPFLAERANELDFDDVAVLNVRVDRLRRWYLPGFLCIGDAAHAMSPVGGVGINLAVQDAVAAANLLYEPLRKGVVGTRDLAAVQRRRWMPTVLTQGFQLAVQAGVIGPLLQGKQTRAPATFARIRRLLPPVARLQARIGGYGVRPEHVRIPAVQD